MFTRRKVKKFVDKFADFLQDEKKDVEGWMDMADTKHEAEMESEKLYILEYVFQIFGRHVEQELGIKFFDKEQK